MFHIGLHFIIPALIVGVFYRKSWRFAYCVLIATMLVDIDHLLSTPIYVAERCSIGFHFLHKLEFIAVYFALCFFKKTRLIGLGLSVHMVLDAIDCQTNTGFWVY